MQDYSYKRSVFNSNVNNVLVLLLVGSCVLGAYLIVWHTIFGANPVADIIASQISANSAAETQ